MLPGVVQKQIYMQVTDTESTRRRCWESRKPCVLQGAGVVEGCREDPEKVENEIGLCSIPIRQAWEHLPDWEY